MNCFLFGNNVGDVLVVGGLGGGHGVTVRGHGVTVRGHGVTVRGCLLRFGFGRGKGKIGMGEGVLAAGNNIVGDGRGGLAASFLGTSALGGLLFTQ